MRDLFRWRSFIALSGLALLVGISVFSALSIVSAKSPPPSPTAKKQIGPSNNPFCSKLGKSIQASQGAQMFCKGSAALKSATFSLAPHGWTTCSE